ncbi:hypothetical protein DC090_02780 [Trueperella pyogenes]|nr:hypothetical protein DC090_02780 [Trueperella pyogenes]AWG16179.1 hypothetical protein DDE06_04705 [Trueperella pyogenes]AZR05062.1 erythromycin resistance leader peptide [Trueperella pyogenes]
MQTYNQTDIIRPMLISGTAFLRLRTNR